ncbi:MAG: Do family serine endopeptidase [Candidatus Omnitrophica bacterium]|nr:Do family serine endopeptidase [Candidatus Omnitrophota bacterium]
MKKIISLITIAIVFSLSTYAQSVATLEKLTIDVAASTGKSVVSISSEVKEKVNGRRYFESPFGDSEDDPFRGFFEDFFGALPDREFRRMGLGSGVIIDKDGYILTNAHVVAGATKVKVKLYDGREFDAEVKGSDERSDLAVVKIKAKDLPVAKLGDSSELKIGNWVVAIGNPFGFAIENPEPTVTVGVVSALHRYLPALGNRQGSLDDLIQTDAAINPGNSGGPLVNLKGEVIGINTAIITTSGGYQGLGFATPIDKAKRILNKLLKGESILYGWLGVSIQNLNEDLRNYFDIKEKKGVIILKVYKDSPAEKSNLNEGDLITEFDGKVVETTRDLSRMVSSSEVGKLVPIKIVRSGSKISLTVKIGKIPENVEEVELSTASKTSFRGLSVEDLDLQTKRKFKIKLDEGVVVVAIENDSLADQSGLMIGDVITKIENKNIKNKAEFQEVVSKIKGNCLVKTNRGYFVLKSK